MVSKKDRDAQGGLQVLSVMALVWTVGFFYWTWGDMVTGSGMGQVPILCCNSLNILLAVIFAASWIHVKRENLMKNHLEEYMKSHGTVSVKHLADTFNVTDASAAQTLATWLTETAINGDYDTATGVFSRGPVETASPEIIDVEFRDMPDVDSGAELPFCPDCGGKLAAAADGGDMWCGNCRKRIQSR